MVFKAVKTPENSRNPYDFLFSSIINWDRLNFLNYHKTYWFKSIFSIPCSNAYCEHGPWVIGGAVVYLFEIVASVLSFLRLRSGLYTNFPFFMAPSVENMKLIIGLQMEQAYRETTVAQYAIGGLQHKRVRRSNAECQVHMQRLSGRYANGAVAHNVVTF